MQHRNKIYVNILSWSFAGAVGIDLINEIAKHSDAAVAFISAFLIGLCLLAYSNIIIISSVMKSIGRRTLPFHFLLPVVAHLLLTTLLIYYNSIGREIEGCMRYLQSNGPFQHAFFIVVSFIMIWEVYCQILNFIENRPIKASKYDTE